jgi:hypothetical protein
MVISWPASKPLVQSVEQSIARFAEAYQAKD